METSIRGVYRNGPECAGVLPELRSSIDFSSYCRLASRFTSAGCSIKYVISGVERYKVNTQDYAVTAGSYLLTNACSEGSILIDSKVPVRGLCFEIAPALLGEVLAAEGPEPEDQGSGISHFMTGPGFPERPYEAAGTRLGAFLLVAAREKSCASFRDEGELREFLFLATELLVADQRPVYRYFTALGSVKPATRKELLKRLLTGKEYIDSCFREPMGIACAARAATLSEYYFFRLFKRAFGTTPHRYLMHKRLEYASDRLRGGATVGEVAYAAGFADVPHFSKAFKKHFGTSPSR